MVAIAALFGMLTQHLYCGNKKKVRVEMFYWYY